MIYEFPVFTGKIEHAQTVCTRPFLLLEKGPEELVQIVDDITPLVTAAFDTITEDNCRGWIQHCGYQV